MNIYNNYGHFFFLILHQYFLTSPRDSCMVAWGFKEYPLGLGFKSSNNLLCIYGYRSLLRMYGYRDSTHTSKYRDIKAKWSSTQGMRCILHYINVNIKSETTYVNFMLLSHIYVGIKSKMNDIKNTSLKV